MTNRSIGYFLLMALLLSASSSAGQSAPAAGAAQETYAESPDGLKSLLQDILAAKKAHDDARLDKLLNGLVLLNHEAWMVDTFGEPLGKRVATTYTERIFGLPDLLSAALSSLLEQYLTRVEIITRDEPFVRLPAEGNSPAIILGKLHPVRLYDARFLSEDGQKTKSLWHFAYVDGGFRYIGTLKPAPVPTLAEANCLEPSHVLNPAGSIDDLQPYLDRVLSSVRRNWLSMIPESARRGEKGCVVVQFHILPNGSVAYEDIRVLISSGKEELDGAAISSIRLSSPFEPLPSFFHEPQLELRFGFLYKGMATSTQNPMSGGVIDGVIEGMTVTITLSPSLPPQKLVRIRMGGNVMQAKLTKMVQPKYPSLAAQAGITGTVRLHAIVARNGSVAELEVVSGHPLLVRAALDAVKKWRYEPTLLNGEPVEVDTTVDVVFSLDNKPEKKAK